MFDSVHHMDSNFLEVGSGIESCSFVDERFVFIDLVQLSYFRISPHRVTVHAIQFHRFNVITRDLETAHVHRFVTEGMELRFVRHA